MITLARAVHVSKAIAEALQPFCERIEVAGSVRRLRPHVNDIDFVVQVKPGMHGQFVVRATGQSEIVKNGPDILIVRLRDGTQVDFYFAHGSTIDLLGATPSNFGSVLLCRTGSKEYNIYIAQTAKQRGYKWETMIGITKPDGTILASETEEGIFRALDLPFIQPEDRERV